MSKFSNRPFMTISDVNNQFEGKWVLLSQNDSSKFFVEGFVVAIGEDNDEDFTTLADMLASELTNNGFVHFAHVDKGESFHVIFDKIA